MKFTICFAISLLVFYLNTYAGNIKGKINIPDIRHKRIHRKKADKSIKMDTIPSIIFIKGGIEGSPVNPELKKKYIMAQKNTQFQPPYLIIPVGSTVDFPNKDHHFHNIFSYSKTKRFDLGRYHFGESKNVLFDKPGIVRIYCEIHSSMRGAIIVVENNFYTVSNQNKKFFIKNIPEGNYELIVWNIDFGKRVFHVSVPSSGDITINVD